MGHIFIGNILNTGTAALPGKRGAATSSRFACSFFPQQPIIDKAMNHTSTCPRNKKNSATKTTSRLLSGY
eukprot:g19483.t1